MKGKVFRDTAARHRMKAYIWNFSKTTMLLNTLEAVMASFITRVYRLHYLSVRVQSEGKKTDTEKHTSVDIQKKLKFGLTR